MVTILWHLACEREENGNSWVMNINYSARGEACCLLEPIIHEFQYMHGLVIHIDFHDQFRHRPMSSNKKVHSASGFLKS
jgi:hypothetical protein